jgi:hypothetical protein
MRKSRVWSFRSWSRELNCRSLSREIETFCLFLVGLVGDGYVVVGFGERGSMVVFL